MKPFLEAIKDHVLILDGAMGTILHNAGFTGNSESLNLSNPNLIKSIHKSYASAGADIIITNTFGANSTKISSVVEVNSAAVKIARKSAPHCYIAGGIGPLNQYIEPLGALDFDKAYSIYSEHVKGLKDADLIIIETISDIKTLKAAIIAVKDNCNLPVIVSMTFQDGRTSTGTDVGTYVTIADSLGADVIGVNCSEGPEKLLEVAEVMVKNTGKPVMVEPNAGLPKIINGKTVFTLTPEEFARYGFKFYEAGVSLLGGCCGTTPDHIRSIAHLKEKVPISYAATNSLKLCSRTRTLPIEDKCLIIGERINPTGKKIFQEEIKQERTSYIKEQALLQVKEGASLLDVNVGVAGSDEVKMLPKAVSAVQSVVDVPIVIDTSNLAALEAALKECDGKPVINSANGKNMHEVFKLAKKYGAAVIILALKDKVPETREERLANAKYLIEAAKSYGINDIIVDCLVLSIATNPDIDNILIDCIKEIESWGYRTVLGVSNISHGMPRTCNILGISNRSCSMPNRAEINSKFLTRAINAGLDFAILNPLDNIVQENTEIRMEKPKINYKNLPAEDKLYNAALYGDEENIISLVESALSKHTAIEVNNILIKALGEVGNRFNKKEFFLPNVLASAAAVKKAFSVLKDKLSKSNAHKGTVLFATVENDVHDIGKNIVIALLESHGYTIIDLGKDVPAEKIVEAAKKYNPDIIALSALMTTTVMEMEKVVKQLRYEGIKAPVIIGGAVVTEDYASQLHAAYSKDALSAVKKVSEIVIIKDTIN